MKNTTTQLAVSNLKTNKSRSVLICISIMLTTMLLTIIALAGYGTIKERKINAGLSYGEHFGAYVRVDSEIYQKIKIHSEIYDVGMMQTFAQVSLDNADGMLSYMDKKARELSHATACEGTFPLEEHEITGQRGLFEQAGYKKPKIGDHVTLNYRIGDGEVVTSEFVISGFLAENEVNEIKKSYSAYVSQAFYENVVPESKKSYNVCFKVKGEEELNEDQMEEKIYSLASELGIPKQQVVVNSSYIIWLLDPGLENIAICCVIAAVVVLFSSLVIYNIFYVGIIQKVQEYGKLRAIGTTKKQIKRILLKEGMILSGISVPVGVLTGLLISHIFFQWMFDKMYENMSVEGVQTVSVVNVPLMLLAAGITFMTVYISLRKPMEVASGISPVEAMRYQEQTNKGTGIRRGYSSINVSRLIMSNLVRNKKRTFTTIMTMGLSCILFVVIANVAGNMDAAFEARNTVEKGDFHIELNADVDDTAYPENNLNHVQQLGLMSDNWLEELRLIEGVNEVETRQGILALRENVNDADDELYTWVNVLSKEDYEKRETMQGTIDYEDATQNNGILFGSDYWMEYYGYAIGDIVKLTFYDGDREIPMEFTITGSTETNGMFVLTEEQLAAMKVNEDMTTDVWISCDADKVKDVESVLRHKVAENDYYSLTTYTDAYKIANSSVVMLKGALYALLGIIGIIGFMNMANTLITSMITRRREFGILQAIGMTSRQLKRMMQMEGLVFTIGTLIVALTLGNVLGYVAFLKCKANHIFGIATYSVPMAELITMTVILLLLQTILSGFMSRYLQKDALIERVRFQE